jgi:signal transduction histidine kinase
VLKRSLAAMRGLIDVSLGEVRGHQGLPLAKTIFSLATFVEDARTAAQLDADARGCVLLVSAVDPVIRIEAHRELLLGALENLLKNAFKFTHRNTAVTLHAYALNGHVFIDVEDRCGGLSPGSEEAMFSPFAQMGIDKTGLGLGLSIARRNVAAMGGTLNVRNMRDVGCVFTIEFPLSRVDRRQTTPNG